MSKIVKLRLIIDVDYDLSEGASKQDAIETLEALPSFCADNGLISGYDSPLLVDEWTSRVERRE